MNHQTRRRAIAQVITSGLAGRTTRIGLVLIAVSMIAIGVTSLIRRVSAITAAAPATVLVSGTNGTATTSGNASSSLNAIGGKAFLSADGRYVAFVSASSNLAPNATTSQQNIFVRDLQTNATTLVSVNKDGVSPNSFSGSPVISPNGRYVVFGSQATDILATFPCGGVFVRDLVSQSTVSLNGCSGGSLSSFSFSADGHYLVFESNLNLDSTGHNIVSSENVYVRDMVANTTSLVSANSADNASGNFGSGRPSISDDGNFVTFESLASDLTATPINSNVNTDVYVRNLQTKKTAMISTNTTDTAGGNNIASAPIISGDGKTVVFRSVSSNLVVNDTNNHEDTFARRISSANPLTLGPTVLVSINSAGTNGGNADSDGDLEISRDGRYVVFPSSASDLVANDSNGFTDVFLRDLQANTTSLISVRSDGLTSADGSSSSASINGDGTFVTFYSNGGNLVSNDSNGAGDVFQRNLYTATTTLASVKSNNSTSGSTGINSYATDRSGNTIAFTGSTDIMPGVGGGQIFARTNLNPQVPASITLSFDGKLRDRVGQGDAAITADGQLDGTFTVTLAGSSTRQIVLLDINRGDGNEWDTIPGNANWVVGAARSLDGALLNNAAGLVNFTIADGESLKLFGSDNGNLFVGGKTFTVLVRFSDGTQATANLTIPNPTVDLDVQVSDSPDPVVADSTLTYTMSVMNRSTITAPNVLAKTAVPVDTNFILSGTSQGCVQIGTTRNVECSFGSIVAGDTISKQITVRPTGNSSPLPFNVSVLCDLPDSNATNNSAVATTIVVPGAPPANDNFLNPIQLSGMSGTKTGTNVNATPETPIDYGFGHIEPYELNHASVYGAKSVWYYWTPPANGTGSMSLNTSSSDFDTLLAVYSVETTNFTLQKEIASNDNVLGSPISAVNFSFDSRHVYYFVVDGSQGATGKISLNWTAVVLGSSSATVQQRIDIGISPSITCTSTSTAPDICNRDRDTSGNFVLRIKGHGFTQQSRVIIKGFDIFRFGPGSQIDYKLGQIGGDGRPYDELDVHVPPLNFLSEIMLQSIRVITPHAASGAGNAGAPQTEFPELVPIPDGTYDVAYGSRGLHTIEAKTISIPPGETKVICGNVAGAGEVCMEWHNTSAVTTTFSPTFFAEYSKCLTMPLVQSEQCTTSVLSNSQFATNPGGVYAIPLTIRQRLDLAPGQINSILNSGGQIGIAIEGGQYIPGTGLIATGGGNLIATGGGNLIATGGGNLIATGGGNLIAQDGGTLITNDGGTLITNDGGTLLGKDGSTFTSTNGFPGIATGATASTNLLRSFMFSNAAGLAANSRPQISRVTTSSGAAGVGGLILATSSGGQRPTFSTTTDPVTGEVAGYVTINLDDTSFPRVSDLGGMAFSVVVNPSVVQFATDNVTVDKAAGRATVTITRSGDKSGAMTVDYATGNGTANDRSDYSPTFGSVIFAAGETSKNVTVPLINHGYGISDFGGQRNFHLIIVNVFGGAIQLPNYATVTITNSQTTTSATNPLNNADAEFYVRQQYLDFLGREPDQSGLNFWKNSITSCGSDQQCLEVKRINASAAFFLSIEFQHTGYYVERMYKAAYGNASGASTLGGAHPISVPVVRFNEFLTDRQETAAGVIVGQTGWEALLDSNKEAFAADFAHRNRFVTAFPATMTEAQFVGQLNSNVGGLLSTAEVNQLVIDLNAGTKTRAQVLRAVADNSKVATAESNRAFVLMQFFGYLRRNPNEGPDSDYTGFEFWLNKLNSFNGDYSNAEMVKAFITSGEYRNRFGL